MAKSLNKVQLIGRLAADPEERTTGSGIQVTTFTLVTNRRWTGKDGTQQNEADFHSIVAWDKLGQVCKDHLAKGRLVYVEGRLHTRSFEANGQKQYRTEIVASDMLMLDSNVASGEDRSTGDSASRPQRQAVGVNPAVTFEDEGDLPF